MLIRRSHNVIDLPQFSEITPRAVFESRRSFMRQLALGSIATGSMLVDGVSVDRLLAIGADQKSRTDR